MPPKSYLNAWKKEIEEFQKNNSGQAAYIDCNLKKQTKYDYQTVNQLLKIHKALDFRKEVQQELDWFAAVVDWPADVKTRPQLQGIEQFQNLLYSSRFDAILPHYGMAAEELSKLCCTRWLSCDHVCWLLDELNKAQEEIVCVYMNFVTDINRFIARRITPRQQKPSIYIFVLNVGKDQLDGSVYLGSDAQPGNHWTICHVDMHKKVITYGDSLAWPSPKHLLGKIERYVRGTHTMYEEIFSYSFVYAHEPSSVGPNGRLSDSLCVSLYPLQRCASVCGVVVLVMAATACLAPGFFSELTERISAGSRRTNPTFLKDPTKYSKYLRLVLMSWFSEKNINISNVLPSESVPTQSSIQECRDKANFVEDDSNKQREPRDDPTKQHEVSNNQHNVSTKQRDNPIHQHHKPSVQRDTTILEPEKKTKGVYVTVKGQNKKPNHRNVSASLQGKKTTGMQKGVKIFECQHCDLTCADKSNLKRHIKRKHQDKQEKLNGKVKSDVADSISFGKCLCRENGCDYSCRRIVELRKHLSQFHDVIFRTEDITLQSYKGTRCF
jgi:hypothetical protein